MQRQLSHFKAHFSKKGLCHVTNKPHQCFALFVKITCPYRTVYLTFILIHGFYLIVLYNFYVNDFVLKFGVSKIIIFLNNLILLFRKDIKSDSYNVTKYIFKINAVLLNSLLIKKDS